MKHDTEALLHLETKVVTSCISYLYECPACKEVRRYAYPPFGWGVFCDGKEFRTHKRKDSIRSKLGRKFLKIGAVKKIAFFILTLRKKGISETQKEQEKKEKDGILIRFIKHFFRKQVKTHAHIFNLARHYEEAINVLPFTVDFVILEDGEMFNYEIMSILWALEDDGMVKRIEGARFKATELGNIVLTQVKVWQ